MKKTFSRFQIIYIHVIFAAADRALRLLCLPHTSAHGRINSVDMRRETELFHYKDYSLHVSSNML